MKFSMEAFVKQEFLHLLSLTSPHPKDFIELRKIHPSASSSTNFFKNRYMDVLALEETRVKIENPWSGGTDYINANYISEKGVVGCHVDFISTQAPLPATFVDFWQMIWEQDSRVICTLNKFNEKGKVKGDLFWPRTQQPVVHGPFTILLEGILRFPERELIIRKFKIRNFKNQPESDRKNSGTFREVYQIHYKGWPDYGVPTHTKGIRDLIHLVKFYNDGGCIQGLNGPIVVHCSAGIGRTGTFLATFLVLESSKFRYFSTNGEFKAGLREVLSNSSLNHIGLPFLEQFRILELVLDLRRQRHPRMVQTESQYGFIYRTVLDELLSPSQEEIPEIIQKVLNSKLEYMCLGDESLHSPLASSSASPSESPSASASASASASPSASPSTSPSTSPSASPPSASPSSPLQLPFSSMVSFSLSESPDLNGNTSDKWSSSFSLSPSPSPLLSPEWSMHKSLHSCPRESSCVRRIHSGGRWSPISRTTARNTSPKVSSGPSIAISSDFIPIPNTTLTSTQSLP
eukprot:TRINITY_DN9132_c1_g1_i3.p1 TRINITY_DN9132_c1_g1~~TRINITY_DN9132_c1_g1_i3.p1  ORF type:complete len:548 (-),score=86.70 TRINITY_DN9132_c1_g1_i3:214-1767(-)